MKVIPFHEFNKAIKAIRDLPTKFTDLDPLPYEPLVHIIDPKAIKVCGKRRHVNEQSAIEHGWLLMAKDGQQMYYYKCHVCGYFHVTKAINHKGDKAKRAKFLTPIELPK